MGRPDITTTVQHLSIGELQARAHGSSGVVERSNCQAIRLLGKGHKSAEVAAVTALSPRWVNKLARCYEREERMRWVTGGGAILAAGRCCRRIWRRYTSVCTRRLTTADSGRGRRWHAGSPLGAGLLMFTRTQLGSAEEAQLVDPEVASEEPEIGVPEQRSCRAEIPPDRPRPEPSCR